MLLQKLHVQITTRCMQLRRISIHKECTLRVWAWSIQRWADPERRGGREGGRENEVEKRPAVTMHSKGAWRALDPKEMRARMGAGTAVLQVSTILYSVLPTPTSRLKPVMTGPPFQHEIHLARGSLMATSISNFTCCCWLIDEIVLFINQGAIVGPRPPIAATCAVK